MRNQALRPNLRVVANRPVSIRPPATPQEMDDEWPHQDVLLVLGKLVAILAVIGIVWFAVAVALAGLGS